MKQLTFLFFIFTLSFSSLTFAQNYQPILPGQTFENRTNDTMIVFTFAQSKNAFRTFEKYQNAKEEIRLLDSINSNLRAQIREHDTIAFYMNAKVESYKKITEACETHAYEMRQEAIRQSRLKTITMVGMAVAFVVGLLLK